MIYRIPDTWLKTFRFESGKPDMVAIFLLADIVAEYDHQGSIEPLEHDYTYYSERLGITERQAKDALARLEKHHRVVFRTYETVHESDSGLLVGTRILIEPLNWRLQEIFSEEASRWYKAS